MSGYLREEEIELSAGLEEDGELYSKARIHEIRGVEEEIIVDRQLMANYGKWQTKLVASLVVAYIDEEGKEIASSLERARKLLVGDRDMIMLYARKLTYGNTMEVGVECPRCGAKLSSNLNIDDIEIKRLEGQRYVDVVLENGIVKEFPDEDKRVFKKVRLKLPNGEIQEKVSKVMTENIGKGNTLMLYSVMEVEGLGNKLTLDDVKNLIVVDRMKMMDAINENTSGPNLTQEFVCSNCGEVFEAPIGVENFFTI